MHPEDKMEMENHQTETKLKTTFKIHAYSKYIMFSVK